MPYGMSDDYVKDLVYTVRKDDGSPVNPEVLRVTVPRDEETGKDRGLAFVKVLDATQAADANAQLGLALVVAAGVVFAAKPDLFSGH